MLVINRELEKSKYNRRGVAIDGVGNWQLL